MTEPLTAAQIIKMIHPDLPPATAHFLLNEAKPLLEWIEAQAEELAKYKQLATTAIDDAVALRAQLAAPAPSTTPPCPYCDGTGHIHSITGEWRGSCPCGWQAPETEIPISEPAPSTAGEQDWLLKSTQDLAKAIAHANYPDVPQFEVMDNLAGVISQIDNMTCGMVRAHGITGEPK